MDNNTCSVQWGCQITWTDGTVEYQAAKSRDEAESTVRLKDRPDRGTTATLVCRLLSDWAPVNISQQHPC